MAKMKIRPFQKMTIFYKIFQKHKIVFCSQAIFTLLINKGFQAFVCRK